jgi:hypothetical protein
MCWDLSCSSSVPCSRSPSIVTNKAIRMMENRVLLKGCLAGSEYRASTCQILDTSPSSHLELEGPPSP